MRSVILDPMNVGSRIVNFIHNGTLFTWLWNIQHWCVWTVVTREPGNCDNQASDIWALTYQPKLYICFKIGASGRKTTSTININIKYFTKWFRKCNTYHIFPIWVLVGWVVIGTRRWDGAGCQFHRRWDGAGCQFHRRWDGAGCQFHRRWDGAGCQFHRRWDGAGCQFHRRWDGAGCQFHRRWDGAGCQFHRRWDGAGCQFHRRWDGAGCQFHILGRWG